MPLFKKTLPDWINLSDLNMGQMSLNENAIDILQNNKDKINWMNLAQNFNGFEIIKNNLSIFNDKKCWNIFCENTPEIPYLKRNIANINDFVLYNNNNAGAFIREWWEYFHKYTGPTATEDMCGRVMSYHLLRSKNIYFHLSIKKYIQYTNGNMAKYLDMCIMEVLCLYEIPGSDNLIELWHDYKFPGVSRHKLTEKDIHRKEKLCMDLYNSNSCMYSIDIDYIEDVIKYVVLASNGLVHSHLGNCRSFWRSIAINPLALGLIEKYLPQMNEMHIRCLFEALSSKPHAIPLLEKHLDKVNWEELSKNPFAIHILKSNPDKINYFTLSENPYIFEYDYERMQANFANTYGKELRMVFTQKIDNDLFDDVVYTIFI